MDAQSYQKRVAEIIATHGHRGNKYFEAAASKANSGWSSPKVAASIRDDIREGLKTFTPDAKYFSADAAVGYACLVADYNSVK